MSMNDRQHPRSIPSRPGQVTNSNPNRLWRPDPQRRTLKQSTHFSLAQFYYCLLDQVRAYLGDSSLQGQSHEH